MPDPQSAPDPVADLLAKSPIGQSVRADAWDAFHSSTNEDDLTAKLQKLPMPMETKATLWDLKHASAQPTTMQPKDKGQIIYSNRPTTIADVGKAGLDVAIGAFKQPGRIVQMVPGVTALTDKLYGLPEGSSEKAMQPTNTTQEVGGLAADVGEMAAGGAASGVLKPAMALTDMSVFPVEAGSYASRAAGLAQRMTGGLMTAARKDLMNGGPITAEKIGAVAYKYGKTAAKYAAIGLGAKHLLGVAEDLMK